MASHANRFARARAAVWAAPLALLLGASVPAGVLAARAGAPEAASRAGEDRIAHPPLPRPRALPGGGVLVPHELARVMMLPDPEWSGGFEDAAPAPAPAGARAARLASVAANVRANNTAGDVSITTNSETSIAFQGADAVASWNDGLAFSVSPGGTGYAYSTDGGATFTDGGILPVPGSSARHEGDGVVAADDAGHFYISDLYTPDGTTSAVAVTSGSFTGATLTWSLPVVAQSTVSDFIDKPWLAADRANGNLYLVYTLFHSPNPTTVTSQILFTRSLDHGATWSAPLALTSTSAEDVQGARVAVGPDHEVQVIYMADDNASGLTFMRTRRSTTLGASFVGEVTLPTGPSGVLSNYGSGPPGFNRPRGVGFPSLAIDRSPGPRRGHLVATWEETVNFYDDTLGTLGTISETESNNTASTANPVTIGQAVNGSLGSSTDFDWYSFTGTAGQTVILYLTPPSKGLTGDAFIRLFTGSNGTPSRSALSYFGPAQGLIVYTLPHTGIYMFRVEPNSASLGGYTVSTGFHHAVPGDEVARDTRDAIVQTSADGVAWTARTIANDDPALYDNAFPEAAVDDAGQVFVDWYDHRNDAANGILTDVFAARSSDGGATFEPGVKVNDGASTNWNVAGSNLAPNMGDYSALVANGCTVVANFADGRDGSADSWVAAITERAASAAAMAQDTATTTAGSPVTFTATIGPAFVTGSVQFEDGGAPLGAPVALDGVTGTAQLTTSSLAVGPHAISAAYSGDGCFVAAVSDTITHTVTGATAVTGGGVAAFALDAIAPNPVRGVARVTFALPRDARVRLTVVDAQGRTVATLADGVLPAGRHETAWRAAGRAGAGLYFVRFEAPGFSAVRRLALAP